MASYSTSELRSGVKILLTGTRTIVENELVAGWAVFAGAHPQPEDEPRDRAHLQVGEPVEAADVVDVDMQYLYSDGDSGTSWSRVLRTICRRPLRWRSGAVAQGWHGCIVTLWNGQPPTVMLTHVELAIVTDPGMRGDTVTGGISWP